MLFVSMLQLDHWVHYEKPYQVQAVGPPYPSFELEVEQQRFWGRNYSHLEMTICFRYIFILDRVINFDSEFAFFC